MKEKGVDSLRGRNVVCLHCNGIFSKRCAWVMLENTWVNMRLTSHLHIGKELCNYVVMALRNLGIVKKNH